MSTSATTSTATTVPLLPAITTGRASDAVTEATRRGHAAGYAAGLREAARTVAERREQLEAEHARAIEQVRQECARALTALGAAAAQLRAREVATVRDAQDVLAAAALDLAEALIGVELADGETSARAALTRALADVDAETVRVVRLNPADLRHLDPATAGVRLVGDPSVPVGDAVTELDHGVLDAAIGSALRRARAALLGTVDA
ncbi:FliH/SctL family protein [Actinotalea caeni]|uniref:FliH/SctL family protein n=1 Tax=Actinotalea caeni TaxID=1348467 RepID=UPI0012E1E265|nr:FliH/SctL family protein [Actinotalea caeni]